MDVSRKGKMTIGKIDNVPKMALHVPHGTTPRAAERRGGQLGHFALRPTLLMGPKKIDIL